MQGGQEASRGCAHKSMGTIHRQDAPVVRPEAEVAPAGMQCIALPSCRGAYHVRGAFFASRRPFGFFTSAR